MNNKFILIGGAIVLGVGALLFFQSSQEQEESDMMDEGMIEEMEEEMGEMMPVMGEEMVDEMMAEHTVVYSDEGYNPKELTIKKGDTVTFRNESSRETWPASAMHPSHNAYPGSGIQKCETEERTSIFDACMGLKQGEEWSFVFGEAGEWFYHDHNMADMFGKIIVQE